VTQILEEVAALVVVVKEHTPQKPVAQALLLFDTMGPQLLQVEQ
jgi:hypothetical protein